VRLTGQGPVLLLSRPGLRASRRPGCTTGAPTYEEITKLSALGLGSQGAGVRLWAPVLMDILALLTVELGVDYRAEGLQRYNCSSRLDSAKAYCGMYPYYCHTPTLLQSFNVCCVSCHAPVLSISQLFFGAYPSSSFSMKGFSPQSPCMSISIL
jgi:hypothetical protein